jgi:hypothetical protein
MPMLKFCEHIFDIAQNDYLDNYRKYLTSKKFYDHEDFQVVRNRCFGSLPIASICCILKGKLTDTFALEKLGGLQQMSRSDFKEPLDSNLLKYEDAIGLCWAFCNCIPKFKHQRLKFR